MIPSVVYSWEASDAKYEKYDILRVHEVVIIPPMKNPKKQNENRGQSGKERASDFKSILQKMYDAETSTAMECKNIGYTKDAIPYLYVYSKREYVRI